MTIWLRADGHTLTIHDVAPQAAIELLTKLPPSIRVDVDGTDRSGPGEPHPGGYFGLAVALARHTWHSDRKGLKGPTDGSPRA